VIGRLQEMVAITPARPRVDRRGGRALPWQRRVLGESDGSGADAAVDVHPGQPRLCQSQAGRVRGRRWGGGGDHPERRFHGAARRGGPLLRRADHAGRRARGVRAQAGPRTVRLKPRGW